MLDKIMIWLAPVGKYSLEKLLPMVVLAALGILSIRIAMKLVKKLLEKSKLEKAAHTLILTASRVVLYILLALAVASGLGIDVTGVVALASVLTLAVSLLIFKENYSLTQLLGMVLILGGVVLMNIKK